MKLDATDIKILELLQKDARATTKSLSSQLNLSTTPVFERIKRLERDGIINKYVALIDAKKVDLLLTAFISISLTKHTRMYLEKFVNEVNNYPEVMECYHIAGNFDFLLKVLVRDIEAYESFTLSKLSTIANLGQVHSSFVLSKNIYSTEVSLDHKK